MQDQSDHPPQPLVYRHRLVTRVWHWINAVTVFVMLMSGLMIFNAHPRLYWGSYGANFETPWLAIGSTGEKGFLNIGPISLTTTGVLGRWRDGDGVIQNRAFPGWATIPSRYSLSAARRWHLSFAWILVAGGLAYWAASLLNRHVQRDLLPTRDELRHIGRSLWDHLLFRHPTGEAAKRYNVLQNIAYLTVIFGLLPLVIVAGMAMSPRLDAVWPGWVDLLGGRQSARTLHFLAATGLLLFVLVHLFEVLISGVWNQLRSMITGYYTVPAAARRALRNERQRP